MAGTLSSSPPSYEYNPQPWYFGSQYNSFQISNSGTDTLLGSATISGPDAARFSISGDGCAGATLTDNGTCGVGVSFNPTTGPGTYAAQLEIPSDGSPNPLVIPLSAEALAGAAFSASPPRVDFPATLVGSTSSQVVTITNTGDFVGGIQQAFIVGPAEFGIENDGCSQQELDPGEDCTLTALFTPSAPVDYQGSIFVINGTANEPVLPINLSGKGRLTPGPAPDTRITQRPKKKERGTTAGFQFTSPQQGVSFECKLDKGSFAPCTSPATYVVKRGKHVFQVRAKDADGAVDPTPATVSWRVLKKRAKKG